MNKTKIIIAIAMCYFVFAILLNSVGTVILQSIQAFGVSKAEAATLEGFKDIPIAIVSFLIASFIPRVGYKVALMLALCLVGTTSLLLPSIGQFWSVKLMFAVIGCAFALVKVSVYALIGQVTNDTKAHSSLLNTIEGIFMVGVLSGYWIFAAFLDAQNTDTTWLNVYYLIAGLIAIAAFSVAMAPITKSNLEQEHEGNDSFTDMLKLALQPLVIVFVISAFLYVLVEQGVGSWLPTFNNEVLHLPVDISVQLTSLFAASLALGRLVAGQVLKKVNWFVFLNASLIAMAVLIILTMPLTHLASPATIHSLFDAPLAAFLMPLIGFFMAPIYPLINSVMLSSLPKHRHASMTGLIVVFSALGGTSGSMITGLVFQEFGGQQAFYGAIIPIIGIAIALFFFRRQANQFTSQNGEVGA
ncbi:Predicted trehalose permease, MFS family, FucP subfamily [Pseudoalteromonas luteoviolacea B = ATCC 29581]|nr:Predicted trehalose permease, MFS family, FucP subfamily [Pseudoalteromonas luteoviolacea B = ATCC 29581]